MASYLNLVVHCCLDVLMVLHHVLLLPVHRRLVFHDQTRLLWKSHHFVNWSRKILCLHYAANRQYNNKPVPNRKAKKEESQWVYKTSGMLLNLTVSDSRISHYITNQHFDGKTTNRWIHIKFASEWIVWIVIGFCGDVLRWIICIFNEVWMGKTLNDSLMKVYWITDRCFRATIVYILSCEQKCTWDGISN